MELTTYPLSWGLLEIYNKTQYLHNKECQLEFLWLLSRVFIQR